MMDKINDLYERSVGEGKTLLAKLPRMGILDWEKLMPRSTLEDSQDFV